MLVYVKNFDFFEKKMRILTLKESCEKNSVFGVP